MTGWSGWWFGPSFIFHNSWDDDPIWRTFIFQGGRYTTNHMKWNIQTWMLRFFERKLSQKGSRTWATANSMTSEDWGTIPTVKFLAYHPRFEENNRRNYPLVIEHSHWTWPIYRWFSQRETSIYKGFSMAMLNNQMVDVCLQKKSVGEWLYNWFH